MKKVFAVYSLVDLSGDVTHFNIHYVCDTRLYAIRLLEQLAVEQIENLSDYDFTEQEVYEGYHKVWNEDGDTLTIGIEEHNVLQEECEPRIEVTKSSNGYNYQIKIFNVNKPMLVYVDADDRDQMIEFLSKKYNITRVEVYHAYTEFEVEQIKLKENK